MIMKELSIEEKARAYDEALERARIWKEKSGMPKDKQGILDNIFPELREYGDERIRKFLQHTFTVQYLAKDKLGKWHGEPVSNILSWLEKQGQVKDSAISQHENKTCKENGNSLTSEDERIRKAIIGGMSVLKEQHKETFFSIPIDDCIAWLEKQGESIKIKKGKNYLCTKTHKYAGVEWIEGVKYYSPEDYSLVNQGCTCYCPKYSKEEHNNFFKEVECDDCLEKQGEQKKYTFKSIPRLLDMIEPSDKAKAYCQKFIDTLAKEGYDTDAKIVEEVLKGWNGENVPMAVMDEQEPFDYENATIQQMDFAPKSAMEAIKEEKVDNANKIEPKDYSSIDPHYFKPVDKVEPKFHEGDWITDGYLHCKITDVLEDRYIVDTKFLKRSAILFNNESRYHLWTIKDANPGDVLAAEDKVFIYNGKLDLRGRVCGYCGIYKTYDGLCFTECGIGNYFTYKEPHPATKEQRDLLFSKMKAAGYEWDAEKKELNYRLE